MNGFIPWSDRVNSPGWVVQPNGCEIWNGARHQSGAGFATRGGTKVFVHRVRYEEKYGKMPRGTKLTPTCGSNLCGNPDHWRIMTSDHWATRVEMTRQGTSEVDPDVKDWLVSQVKLWQMPTVKQAAAAYLAVRKHNARENPGKYDGPTADGIISEISRDSEEFGLLVDAMLVIAERMSQQPALAAA